MITVADTGAIIALIDRDDEHHEEMVELFGKDHGDWILPWAILPEIDYVVSTRLGARVATSFLQDLESGAYTVEWGKHLDLLRAYELNEQYASLEFGMMDGWSWRSRSE